MCASSSRGPCRSACRCAAGLPDGDAGVTLEPVGVPARDYRQSPLPFLTSEILALAPRFRWRSTTTRRSPISWRSRSFRCWRRQTFNVLVLASGVLSGYAMDLYACARTGDAARVGWRTRVRVSPFMSARAAEHFSLTLAAPLPIFGWLMFRIYPQPSAGLACAAGATVAWAFLCDAYYAVYCLLIAGFMACYTMFSVETRAAPFGASGRARSSIPQSCVSRDSSSASCCAAVVRWISSASASASPGLTTRCCC